MLETSLDSSLMLKLSPEVGVLSDKFPINVLLFNEDIPVTPSVLENVVAPVTPNVPPIKLFPVALNVPLTSRVYDGELFIIPTLENLVRCIISAVFIPNDILVYSFNP